MKRLNLSLALIFLANIIFAQFPEGKVRVDSLYSNALENSGGENPTRKLSIYLPPEYDIESKHYPVIYYLHGFTGSHHEFEVNQIDKLLDKAIATGKIKPVIVVIPNQHTLYRGSLYTNSSLTGNWADFTANDLVTYVDQNYRTIKDSESRGISGHSMGGYGAIKIGMIHPEVFSSVYSLSGAIGLVKELGIKGPAYKRVQEISSREILVTGYDDFLPNFLIAMGRAFSPNQNKPPFFADIPYSYSGDSLIVDYNTIELWNRNLLSQMADDYVENLRKLKAIKIDWGRNDQFDFVVMGCKSFSQKLENLGIKHLAEEYIGTHGNKLWTNDGRALNDMLPFFDTNLKFE